MLKTFDEIIEQVIKHEGGYNHIKGDAGGETNYGISKRAYPDEDCLLYTSPSPRD